MNKGVNKVIILGHCGQDPEIVSTKNGGQIAKFSVATSESWKDKTSGEKQERTEWHRIVLFGRLAEVADLYLVKGNQVYIEGSNRTTKWQDKDGNDRYTTEVIGNYMQLLGGKQDEGASGNKPSPKPAKQQVEPEFEEYIPF